jgi:putative membrane protein
MPSERRLHPATILFALAGQVREFALPIVVLLVAGSTQGRLQAWALILLLPYGLVAIGRYLTYRYTFEDMELVIRSGLLFRNERHIPYSRIQNLDASQNVFHRALGVVVARVDTGSGDAADATLSVITRNAYEEMRERVFAARADRTERAVADVERPRVLLALPTRELVVLGLIENRGLVVVAGALGLLSQTGVEDRLFERLADDSASGGSFVRGIAAQIAQAAQRADAVVVAAAVVVALLVAIRLLSVALAIVRLHGFTLTRIGEDLRAEFGLLTRVTSTIPLRRVQTVTITAGLLHRAFGRAALRVDTAGGEGRETARRGREQIAPIISTAAWPALLAEILPEVQPDDVVWHPAAPGAVGREFRRRLAFSAVLSSILVLPAGWYAVGAFAALVGISWIGATRYVAWLGWAVVDGAVFHRSGWLRRHISIARLTRIQTVSLGESPFDRRRGMARVLVDTAGAAGSPHRIHIPYVDRNAAGELYASLAAAAARTSFHW